MLGILPSWLKWGGAGVLSLALLVAGFQVASWRAGSIEAKRLKTDLAKAEQFLKDQKAAADKADQARTDQSAEIEQTEAELKARIADLQEQVKFNNNPDCDFPEEAVGVLNRAAGHGPKNK
jgi:cell division protein FtsB